MSENSKTAAEGSATALGGVDVDRLEQRGLCNPEAEPSKVVNQGEQAAAGSEGPGDAAAAAVESTAARLKALFPGHENAHGTHGEPDWDEEKSKWSIKRTARTISGPPTLDLWKAHLLGTTPLGIVPIDAESLCWWGCGDIDDYDVDALALIARIESMKLPLIVCRSKSGGLHLFLFLRAPEPARAVQTAVRAMMASTGHAGAEIFPKQSQLLTDRGDQGNWMVMPYFGGTFGGKLREQAGLKRTGGEMTLGEFLRAAEAARTATSEIKVPTKAKARKKGSGAADSGPFGDGPPCLQYLAEVKVQRGGQNNALLMMGVYFKRAHPEDWRNELRAAASIHLDPPGDAEAVQGVIRSLEKKDYRYTCRSEPMVSCCNSKLCRTREFGVGGGDGDIPPYVELNGALAVMTFPPRGSPYPVPIGNFTVRITEERIVDDGQSTMREWMLAAQIKGGGSREATVASTEIRGTWWTQIFGADAVAKPDLAKHLLPAMQTVSTPVAARTIFVHLGWRRIGGRWLYLHGGGAVGSDGPVDGFHVEPGGELAHCLLVPPRDLKAAIRASLEMFDLGALGAELLGAVYRAPLNEFCEALFSYYLAGPSGSFKSAVTGIAQAHWGTRFNGVLFLANWSSTANSLEKIAFLAKDALLVVDDFAPQSLGTGYEANKLQQAAGRLLRAQANRGGRGRMNADGSLRQTYAPRGVIAASGEDVPQGHSLRARMIIRTIDKKDIDKAVLTRLQQHAADGLLAEAMAGYVRWLATKIEAAAMTTASLAARTATRRTEASAADHARTPDNVASLMLGLDCLLDFAEEAGAVDAAQRDEMSKRAWRHIREAVAQQNEEQRAENPAELFREMIRSPLAAGRAHLAERTTGEAPRGIEAACGWRKSSYHDEENGQEHTVWHQQGDRLGWVDGGDMYLLPSVSLASAARLCRDQGRSLNITSRVLGRRLKEAGWIVSADKGGNTTTRRMNEEPGESATAYYYLRLTDFLPEKMPF